MANISIKKGDTLLPSPTDIGGTNELIWSENTQRGTTAGNIEMTGTCLGDKDTFEIKWSMLTEGQFNLIKSALGKGFFSVTITVGSNSKTFTVYRSALDWEIAGLADGKLYYKSVGVSLIEK